MLSLPSVPLEALAKHQVNLLHDAKLNNHVMRRHVLSLALPVAVSFLA